MQVAAAAAKAAADVPSKCDDDSNNNGGSSSLLLLLSVVVIALSLALLPMAGVTVIMAAMAGLWWLSSGVGSSATVQMSSLPEAAAAGGSQSAGTAAEEGASAPKQDENLGLNPPEFRPGRSVTAKRAALAAAAPPPPARKVAAPVPAPTAAVPAVAGGDGTQQQAPPAASSISAAAGAANGSSSALDKNLAAPAQPQQPQAAAPAAEPALASSTPADAAAAAAPAVALTGSAAILAKLRQQRASTSSSGRNSTGNSLSKRDGSSHAKVTVLYASQTGTGQEIARSIHAECAGKGLPSQVMSMNELGFDSLTADKTPVVVVVASSTGDGDPPDNSAAAFVAIKKSWPADRLAGVKFTVLGLGDSNYTRYMHVPRVIKSRMQDLGAACFYPCAEADEVDGLEATVDPWVENILGPLQTALQELQQPAQDKQQEPAASAAASRPASAVVAAAAAEAAAVAKAEAAVPSANLWPEASAMSATSATSAGAAAGAAVAATAAAATAVPAATATTAAAEPSPRVSLSPAASAPVELVDGLAPKGVDLKGVPPLAPCRISLNQQVSADTAAAARERELQLPSREQMSHRDPTGAYSAAAPFWATVADAKLLTAESSDRTVIHVELSLSDSGMRFAAGDAVGVLPANDPALVAAVLARLGVDGDDVFEVQPASEEDGGSGQALLSHISWPCTFRHAFMTSTDLTSVPRKSLLRLLAEHCSDEDEQRTLLFFTSRAGRDAYAQEVAAGQPSLLDLLRRFPSCQPPVHALLDALPPLAPRMYSLTNAPVECDSVPGAVGPKRVQFALSVVEFDTQYGTRQGVATTWLAKLCRPWLSGQVAAGADPSSLPEAWVPLFLRHAAFFKPPASLATPMLMIGPGTGVAPFRGFLQQRLADMKAAKVNTPGQALLYFGCRKAEEDYLYQQDWQEFLEAGALSKLRVAFSRAQPHKVYVQHLLKEDAAEVAKLIAGGAHVYVCGDGAAMAKGVHAALQGILRDKLGMSEAQAAEELMAMTKQGRYVRDIWS